MIELRNVEKFYETGAGRTYVLRRVNLEVREGEFVSIMGPSGSGKTTLLSILGFLDSAWGGEYYFEGAAVHKMNHKERAALHKRHVGFVLAQQQLLLEREELLSCCFYLVSADKRQVFYRCC